MTLCASNQVLCNVWSFNFYDMMLVTKDRVQAGSKILGEVTSPSRKNSKNKREVQTIGLAWSWIYVLLNVAINIPLYKIFLDSKGNFLFIITIIYLEYISFQFSYMWQMLITRENSMLILYDWPQWSFINTNIIENALRDVSAHI